MNDARPEADVGPWERLTDPSITFNELCREYKFKNLAGPGTASRVELRCRLIVKDTPAGRTVTPFVFLVFHPYLLEQTQSAVALFGPSDDLVSYKVLPVKIEAAASGINFVVFDVSDGDRLLEVLMLGRQITLNLILPSGGSIANIPLENDHSFRTEYKSFKSELLAGHKRERVHNAPINNLPPQHVTIFVAGDEIWITWPQKGFSVAGRSFHIPGGAACFSKDEDRPKALLQSLRNDRDLWAPGNETGLIRAAKASQS